MRTYGKIQSLGFTGYIETDNSAEAWFGTIPGIPDANCRRPIVSSLNFCHLAPLTAIWSGDKRNNYLKGAVLLYTDTSGSTPFRLSLHVGDLGHTMVIGPSGSGKSVLLNTLEAHFKKYKNKVDLFYIRDNWGGTVTGYIDFDLSDAPGVLRGDLIAAGTDKD